MSKKKKKAKNNNENKRFSASHIMLYVALLIYIFVVISGIVFLKYCIDAGETEIAQVIFVSLASLVTVCGSTTIGFYASKASRENILQISNGKYRMRLELAKEIYKEFKGATLDEKSMQFMRTLISDENVSTDSNFISNTEHSGIGVNISTSYPTNFNEDGLG